MRPRTTDSERLGACLLQLAVAAGRPAMVMHLYQVVGRHLPVEKKDGSANRPCPSKSALSCLVCFIVVVAEYLEVRTQTGETQISLCSTHCRHSQPEKSEVELWPRGQSSHCSTARSPSTPGPLNLPSGHCSHVFVPTSEYRPTAHDVHSPPAADVSPAPQSKQPELPTVDVCPAAQLMQPVASCSL